MKICDEFGGVGGGSEVLGIWDLVVNIYSSLKADRVN